VVTQRRIQLIIGDGSTFENHGQVMKRVNQLLNEEKDALGPDCRACVVRQFARQVPIADQLPCVQRKLSALGVQTESSALAPRSVGTDQPLSAVKVLLKATSTAEKALFLSKDAAIYPPLANTPTDPTLFGATIELCSAQGSAAFDLPAHLWHMSGSGSVFKFTRTGSGADVKVALIKGGRTLKIVSKAVGIPLPGALGAVGVRVTTGDVRNCALFTLGTIVKDEPGKYVARGASGDAVADCSDASLGCSFAP